MIRRPPKSTLFPYPTLFQSVNEPPVPVMAITWTATGATVRLVRVKVIGRAHVELQSPCNLVCRLLLEKKKDRHGPGDRRRAGGQGPSRQSRRRAAIDRHVAHPLAFFFYAWGTLAPSLLPPRHALPD